MSNRLGHLAAEIRCAHTEVQSAAKAAAERAIEAGHALIEAKGLVGHGQWLPWLQDHCAMPERTARQYIRIAQSGLKLATVADLGLNQSERIASVASRLEIDAEFAAKQPFKWLADLDKIGMAIWPEPGGGRVLRGNDTNRGIWAITTRDKDLEFAEWKGLAFVSGDSQSSEHAFLTKPVSKFGVAAVHASFANGIGLSCNIETSVEDARRWYASIL